MPEPARVLLLEDDALVRHFVQAALDGMELTLLACASVAEARQMLCVQTVQLVLTDMHLPHGSGLDLLHWMQEQGHASRTVVFSGGVDAALQRRLHEQGVWRVLHKPVAVGTLIECVQQGLTCAQAAPSRQPTGTDVVARYFDGNHALYSAYRQSCLGQLVQDVAEGDHAVQAEDLVALHRVAHNFKSLLVLLGQEQAAQVARTTEEHAAKGTAAPAYAGWEQLRLQVLAFEAQHGLVASPGIGKGADAPVRDWEK